MPKRKKNQEPEIQQIVPNQEPLLHSGNILYRETTKSTNNEN